MAKPKRLITSYRLNIDSAFSRMRGFLDLNCTGPRKRGDREIMGGGFVLSTSGVVTN